MLYTDGFMLAGVLAAALTLRACADVVEAETKALADGAADGTAQPTDAWVHLGALLGPSDVDALSRLSDALGSHTMWRHELIEPDRIAADHAYRAAMQASGRTRETLLSLAASAERSALAFLVDYSLAAGGWEAETGLRMGAPAIERL